MSNHFHILLHVLPPQELADEELVGRVAALYGSERAEKLRVEWASYRRIGDESAMHRLEEERAALLRRMGDLSQYMKELKQVCAPAKRSSSNWVSVPLFVASLRLLPQHVCLNGQKKSCTFLHQHPLDNNFGHC